MVSALVTPDGKVVRHSGRHLHEGEEFERIMATVERSVHAVMEGLTTEISVAGAGVAAQVDERTGVVLHAPNLGWTDRPFGERLEEMLGVPVRVLNDARAATFGEWKLGAGAGETDLFYLVVGTGIGGSAVVDGQMLRGSKGAAGEVGHMTIVSGGRRCHCPNRGCLEAYAGGWAIAERAQEAARREPKRAGGLLRAAGGTLREITARRVFDAYRARDRLAGRIVRETLEYLADGAVGIANAFNPQLMVLGGGVVEGLPETRAAVERGIRLRCQPPASRARVVRAGLGEDGVVIGAAAWARDGST